MHRPEHFFKLARLLHRRKIPLLPRVLDRVNQIVFHVYLRHKNVVGNNLELGYHGVGVAVHPDVIIGDNVFLAPFVAIGPKAAGGPVPAIGNDVYVATGAKILGGISIGDGAVIGANAVVTKPVPAGSIVAGIPARVTKRDIDVRAITGWPYVRNK